MKMELNLPKDTTVSINNGTISVKGPKGELSRTFNLAGITAEQKDSKVIFMSDATRKKNRAYLGTVIAKTRNMIKGTTEGYQYKLRAVFKHFPMNITVQGNALNIKNFMGEKRMRKARIFTGAKVEIDEKDITVSGIDIDIVSQTAASFEMATRLTGRDRRVFQDGIFITKKGR
ncbi:MAG: 50S ribosomal protein L6 [DPANN group archaeon]|nr:50S ribosomal protein L6 [DPANN group archaeon]